MWSLIVISRVLALDIMVHAVTLDTLLLAEALVIVSAVRTTPGGDEALNITLSDIVFVALARRRGATILADTRVASLVARTVTARLAVGRRLGGKNVDLRLGDSDVFIVASKMGRTVLADAAIASIPVRTVVVGFAVRRIFAIKSIDIGSSSLIIFIHIYRKSVTAHQEKRPSKTRDKCLPALTHTFSRQTPSRQSASF